MKKGFTLIELLAVIVILAIIALIAVPIVINIINSSKEESEKRSVDLYGKAVEQAVADYQIKNPKDKNITVEKIEQFIKYNGNEVKCNIQLNDNKVGLTKCKVNGKKVLDLETADEYYHYGTVIPIIGEIKENSEHGVDYDGKNLQIGNEVEIKVKKQTKYTFYVIYINKDKDGSDISYNLIMDSNICEDGTINYTEKNNYCRSAWHANEGNNNYGPDTVMKSLYNATKDWKNIPDMIMDYTDENNKESLEKGYKGITTINGQTIIEAKNGASDTPIGNSMEPLKARLATEEEITLGGCKNTNSSCPYWLVQNLEYEVVTNDKYSKNNGNNLDKLAGYWLLSSSPNSNGTAYYVAPSGFVRGYDTRYPHPIGGIRPVITLPKENISL